MATPDLHEELLTGDDEAVIMATDGLWDVISNQEAVDFIRDIKVPRLCLAFCQPPGLPHLWSPWYDLVQLLSGFPTC